MQTAINLFLYPVIGCADMKYPAGAWYKREGDVVTIGCENKYLSWTLKCDGLHWKGSLGNCSEQGKKPVLLFQINSQSKCKIIFAGRNKSGFLNVLYCSCTNIIYKQTR